MQINVFLPANRNETGILQMGTWHAVCLGRSDGARAAAAGNPTRDPLKPFGDIPTGEYTGYVTVPGKPERSYGPYRRIALDPITGDAFEAKRNGRYGLMIHGGDLSSKGALRPTHGCLRLSNADMLELLRLIDGTKRQSLRVVVAEKSSPIS